MGQCHAIFRLRFYSSNNSSGPNRHVQRRSRILSNIHGVIRIPNWLPGIGGHSVRYPWSVISDWAWYRNVLYRTEERRVRHYIGFRNKLLFNIRYLTKSVLNHRSAVVSYQIFWMKVVGSKPERKFTSLIILLRSLGNDLSILDIGISNIDLVGHRNGSRCWYRNERF